MHAFNGFGFGTSVQALNTALRRTGFSNIQQVIAQLTSKDSSFLLEENNLNGWAYALMDHKEQNHSLAIFELNTRLHPGSWNTFDSYGEALRKANREEEAKKMYQKSATLKPGNKKQ